MKCATHGFLKILREFKPLSKQDAEIFRDRMISYILRFGKDPSNPNQKDDILLYGCSPEEKEKFLVELNSIYKKILLHIKETNTPPQENKQTENTRENYFESREHFEDCSGLDQSGCDAESACMWDGSSCLVSDDNESNPVSSSAFNNMDSFDQQMSNRNRDQERRDNKKDNFFMIIGIVAFSALVALLVYFFLIPKSTRNKDRLALARI